MARKYSEEELTRAVLLMIDHGLSPSQAELESGVNKRSIFRFKSKYLNEGESVKKISKLLYRNNDKSQDSISTQQDIDDVVKARAKFLRDIMKTKQVLLDRLEKIGKKSNNLDAIQRSIKTLSDVEVIMLPKEDDIPEAHVKNLNLFQFFNQKLINEGYEGPKFSDADIVKGD